MLLRPLADEGLGRLERGRNPTSLPFTKVLLSGRREERLRVLLDQPSLDFHATVAGLSLTVTEWVLRRGRQDFIAMVAGEVGAVWQLMPGDGEVLHNHAPVGWGT